MCTTAISKGRRTLTVGTHLEKTCSTSLKKQFPENYNNVCLAFQFLEIHETPANMGEQFNCLHHLQYGWWSNLSWEKQFRMKNFCNHWESTQPCKPCHVNPMFPLHWGQLFEGRQLHDRAWPLFTKAREQAGISFSCCFQSLCDSGLEARAAHWKGVKQFWHKTAWWTKKYHCV